MKNLIFLFLISVWSSSYAQRILIADNNLNAPQGDDVFPTAQQAVDAAVDGDIVQIAPSDTNYGDIVISKSVTILGIGYNPNKDSPYLSALNNIDLSGPEASGTILSGLITNVINLVTDTGVPYSQNEVTIQSCRLNRVVQNTNNIVSNLLLTKCIINNSGGSFAVPIALAFDSNILTSEISNNIIDGYRGGVNAIGSVSAGNFTVIRNNLFIGPNNVNYTFAFQYLQNCIVSNNIFFGRSPWSVSNGISENNTYSNNLSFGMNPTMPPPSTGTGSNTGTGNIENTDPMFTSIALGSIWDFAFDITLQPGSPAIGSGTDATDLGILGGSEPFVNYGTGSPIPVIRQLNTPGLVNEGENLQISIEAEGN